MDQLIHSFEWVKFAWADSYRASNEWVDPLAWQDHALARGLGVKQFIGPLCVLQLETVCEEIADGKPPFRDKVRAFFLARGAECP